LLDSRTGEEIYAWRAHTQGLAAAFDPQGKRLATGSRDQTLKIWRLEGRAAELELSIDTGPVRMLAFSPDGRMIAAVGDWGFLGIWDAESGEVLLFSHIPQARLSDIRFSPDGKRLVLAGLDGSLQIREVADPQADPMILKDDQEGVLAAAFSGDGSLLVSTGMNGRVIIWNALTSEELFTISAHSSFTTSAVFSLDGSWLATGSLDGQIILWDLSTRQAVKKFNLGTGIYTIDLSRDGQRLSAAGMGGTIGIWNVGLVPEGGVFHTKSATGRLAFSPDGAGLAAGVSAEGEVRVWNPTTREELLTLEPGEAAELNLTGEAERDEGGHNKDVQSTAYNPDGQILATASMDGTVKLWNSARGEQLRTLLVDPNGVHDLAFSPDGRWLAAAGSVRLRLWETHTWTQSRSWTAGSGQEIYAVEFSPDSKKVAVGLSTGVAVIGEIGPEGLINTREIAAHKGALFDLSFSPDGNRLATAGSDGAARVWNVESSQEVFSLLGHHLEVMGAAYSPDGKLIATASLDGTVRLWDAETGNEVLAIPGTGLAIPGTGIEGPYGLAFSPDGKTLAATAGTAVSLYLLDVEELAGVGRSRIVRNFTPAECAKYAITGNCLTGARPTPQPRQVKTTPDEKLICFLSSAGGLTNPYSSAVYKGIQRISAREGWSELVLAPYVPLESVYLLEFAFQAECELIVVLSLKAGDLERAAERLNTEQRFLIIDAPALNDLPGLWGQVYAVDQPAFLAGYLAAAISKTGVIGTFGGQEMQSVTDFMEGFARGAAHYNSRYSAKVTVLGWDSQNEEGVFIGSFDDVERAKRFTQDMIEQGADVIFPVAGGVIGPAVLETAAGHEGVLFIGVDVDYALEFPVYGEVILTSVEKRMEQSVIRAAEAIERGDFSGGTYVGTLETGEVGLSPFYVWETRIPEQIKADLEEIKAKILSGEIQTR
jgi:WD40 repeat protein/basic membrane lipoprotein Med (substrate-binding protein (PBP1-ABC) superfamily)